MAEFNPEELIGELTANYVAKKEANELVKLAETLRAEIRVEGQQKQDLKAVLSQLMAKKRKLIEGDGVGRAEFTEFKYL